MSVTGFWQTGNVEMLAIRNKIEAVWKPTNFMVFKTQNAYLYQEFFEQKADEDIFSRNFVYFNPQKRFYPFVLGFVSTNFRRKIDLRYFVGTGFTWQAIRHKNHLLKIALSGEYENSRFTQNTFNETEYNGNFEIATWRATAWIFGKHQVFQKKITFHYEVYFQPSVERANNFRWQADIGLDLPISKHFDFRVNYLYTFEKIVVSRQKQDDSILSFGLKLKL